MALDEHGQRMMNIYLEACADCLNAARASLIAHKKAPSFSSTRH